MWNDSKLSLVVARHIVTWSIVVVAGVVAFANLPADALDPNPNDLSTAEIMGISCPEREIDTSNLSPERLEWLERSNRYRQMLPLYFARVSETPEQALLMPVEGRRVSEIADTYLAPRGGGRRHEGQDVFAPIGTPIYPAAPGYVYRIGDNPLGGMTVTVVGAAGWRYYYAHLSAYAEDLEEGQQVDVDTLLGYVGNTGNARTTPPHLHFGVYTGTYESCEWNAIDPLPLMVNRSW
jgi:murein DD-endopeptidase MepM/ murein hydrolase activator NlpD